ncbi:cyclic nucleotide-binding domain-containing protein [Legionella sp. CNM-4043-24]|uniref:cyclic nucleotide-binding domain-containing protein n=1 Tax=Legionella sp. CNM-4043-24 TaxID=3421646 RepID=UPI00403A8409
MNRHANLIRQILPFSYLTDTEIERILQESSYARYRKMTVICAAESTENLDRLFLLLNGRVNVIVHNEVIGNIDAPSYFGERSVFFFHSRRATIRADKGVECLIVSRELIMELIASNLSFCYAFASSLRNKQKIFEPYDEFLNLIRQKKIATKLRVVDLLESYKKLSPVLHKNCQKQEIDFFALDYVMARLPFKLTSTSHLVLALDSPVLHQKDHPNKPLNKRSSSKRFFYETLPGRIFTVLRDDVTDYIDFITKLCTYVIESKKIRARLLEKPSAIEFLTHHYYRQNRKENRRAVKTPSLPFSDEETEKLKAIYQDDWLDRLFEIYAQEGELQVQEIFSLVRYNLDLSEIWIKEIRESLIQQIPDFLSNNELNVHIISSNTHSVLNCLSPWVHQKAAKLVDRSKYPELYDETDRLYAGIRRFPEENAELVQQREAFEQAHGIFHLENPGFTGINVSLVDLSKLSSHIDPHLTPVAKQKQAILINIDYAHGKQAEPIIRNLILLFGRKIKSLSILGKTGSVVGNRGELIIPDHFIIQENDFVYPTPRADISPQDFTGLGWQRPMHIGPMLTVLGTLMQNADMLWYYRHFWKITGMEMEGGYFLQEINRAKAQKLIDDDVILRFAYYISDRPLNETETLATKLSLEEGLPAVYAITRVMLKKILAQNEK